MWLQQSVLLFSAAFFTGVVSDPLPPHTHTNATPHNIMIRYMFMTGAKTFSSNRTEVIIEANRVSEGVYPKGSTWTKNPIPIGSNVQGAWQWNEMPPQFPPPRGCDASCWGYQVRSLLHDPP